MRLIWLVCIICHLGSVVPADKKFLPYPDIFIIGAQKCGTTTLNILLQQHSSFCKEGTKEKHFFSDDKAYSTNYQAHVSKFLNEFHGCNKSLLTIDATPSYVWYVVINHTINHPFHVLIFSTAAATTTVITATHHFEHGLPLL